MVRRLLLAGMMTGTAAMVSPSFAQQAAPAAAPKIEISSFDGWTLTCQSATGASTKRACSALLRIFQTDPNTKVARPVFGWVLGVKDGRTVGVFQVPTGVLIQPGVQLQIGKESRTLGYSQCVPTGCEAVIELDDAFIRAASAVPTVDARIIAIDGKGLKFSINMKSFDKVIAELRK